MADNKAKIESIMRYDSLIRKQAGLSAVRPFRGDGYVNLLTRYGTSKDSTEAYRYAPEPVVPDDLLTTYYEGNGLFAKIIDTPAEEAIKHGFTLEHLSDQDLESFYVEALDELDWEETAMTAIKWARLFGGSIIVMLINDGRGLDEPLDWRNIKSIDDLVVYDRSIISYDTSSMYSYRPDDPFRTRGSRLGLPEYYHVSSKTGTFTVHESRCLIFQNGILPENTSNSIYQLWGMPEYVRIRRAIRDAEVAHGSATKLLDRSIQAVYKMKDLSAELATEDGENRVLRRLQTIDMARGLLSSIVIDNDNEDYDFRTFQFNGVADVVDCTCNFLSALTSIPQTILFGRSPAGMNSTGESDLENYYNFIERIDRRMVKKNLRYLLSIVFRAGVATGEVDEIPKIKIRFNPLWSLSDVEQADLDQKRAQTQQTKAQTAQIYVDMQAVDPSEVRKKLADSEDFDVENMLDEVPEDDLFAEYNAQQQAAQGGTMAEQGQFAQYAQGVNVEEHNVDPGTEGSAPASAPAATKLPQDMSPEELAKISGRPSEDVDKTDEAFSVGVLVIADGKILAGTRHNDFGYGLICGPGGHGEDGETPEQAAIRETQEEFGITPTELILLGRGPKENETDLTPYLFLCTDYTGVPECMDLEMVNPRFLTLEELGDLDASLFPPFADSLNVLQGVLAGVCDRADGGPGSGNFGHEGVPGKVGGSAPSGKALNESLKDAYEKGRDEFEKKVKEVLNSVPLGTKIEQFGDTYEKTGDGQWHSNDGKGYDLTEKEVAGMCFDYLAGPHYFGEFQDVKSEDIAEVKVEAGELKPEDTSAIDTPKTTESSKKAEAEETSAKAETEEPKEKSGSSEAESSESGENGGSSESQGEESPSDSQLSSRTKPSLKEPDDFDKYIEANGLKPLYRGYSASSEDQLEEFSDSIKNGTSKVSGENTSAFGVGIYFASSRNEAEGYMQRRQNEQGDEFGKVSTAALDVGAKVGDYGEYEHQKFQDEWDLRGQYFELPKEAKEERQKIRDQADKLARMTVPEYAASKGCDAVYEPGFGYTIVTNPNALVVRNDSASFDGGPGSGNFGHKGVEGQRGGSAPSAQKWRESVGEKRAAMHSEKPNKQAMALWKNGFLDKDTAVAKMKDGSISAEVDRYFDVLEANGDPTPIKKTVTQQRSLASLVDTEYGGDWEKARIGEVAKDTGMTQEEAEKTYRELETWTGSNWSRANSDMLDSYVEKAPTFDGPIFRGLHFTDSDDYDSFMESISSGVVTMGGNSSWSSDESVARRFAHAIDDDVSSVVIRCVANKTAAPIEHITQKGGEDEVIAHSRAAWTVLNVSEYSSYSGRKKAVVTVIERGEFEDE